VENFYSIGSTWATDGPLFLIFAWTRIGVVNRLLDVIYFLSNKLECLYCYTFLLRPFICIVEDSTKANVREHISSLGRVFHFMLASFSVMKKHHGAKRTPVFKVENSAKVSST
jgi:hypothetical protein